MGRNWIGLLRVISLFLLSSSLDKKLGSCVVPNRHSWPLNMNKNVGVLAEAASAIFRRKWEAKLFMDRKVL